VQEELLRQLTDGGPKPHGPDPVPPPVPDHQLLRRIGGGSYGDVWLARNVVGTFRAVKLVYRSSFSSARPYEREFHGMQNYEPVSRRHEGLVDILQIGRNDEEGFFYYVMELADDAAGGPPLAALSEDVRRAMMEAARRRTKTAPTSTAETARETALPEINPDNYRPRTLSSEIRRSGRLAPGDCVPLFLTLTAALSTLHRSGLLHRDIKPSNVVIVGGVPKLADIGLVAEAGAEMSFVGTEGFIAPEGPGTAAADIYALGKMFYESFTGLDRMQFPSLPAGREAMSEVKAMLELSAVANRACAPEASKRYQSAEELLADLALLHSGRSVQKLRMVEKRLHRARRFGLAAAVAAVVAAGVILLLQHLRTGEQRERDALAAALTEAKLQRAVAERIAARPGSRFSVLEAVGEAARTRPGDPGLRSEAITALACADVRLTGTYPAERKDWQSFAWTRDQSQLAVARADGSVRVERPDRSVIAELRGAAAQAPVSIGDSGRWLLTAGEDGLLHLWDVRIPREVWQSPSDGSAATLDPAERWLLHCSQDWKRWTRRDLETGVENSVAPMEPASEKLRSNIMLRSLITGGRMARGAHTGRKIEVRDVATWQLLAERELPAGMRLKSLVLSDDGRWLCAGTFEFSNFIYDLTDPERASRDLRLHRGAVIAGNFSPDGEVFFSTAWDYTTRLFHTATGRQVTVLPSWSFANGISTSSRHYRRVDAASFDLNVYDFAAPVCRELSEPAGPLDAASPNEVIWNADGSLLALCSWHGLRLLHGRSGALVARLKSSRPGFANVQVAGTVFRDDGAIITASAGIYFRAAQNESGRRLLSPPQCWWDGYVYRMRSDRAGRIIAAATENDLRWLDTRSGNTRFEAVEEPFDPVQGPYRVVEMSGDGRWIATAQPGTLRVWNAATGRLHWKAPSEQQWMPVFSPDGRFIAGSDLRHAVCYDVEKKSVLWKTPLAEGMGIFGAWSPDGHMLVLLRRSHTLAALDARTGEVWCQWNHPDQQPITSLAFSPDGRRLAASCHTGVVQVWDIPLLRAGLKERGLDFPLPEMEPESAPPPEPPLIEVRIE